MFCRKFAVFGLVYRIHINKVRFEINMSKTDNLYKRLEDLEAEYKKKFIMEFQNVAKNICGSMYLNRKRPHMFAGKFWRSKEVSEIERLEKDVIKLREKLGEPVPGELVGLVEEYNEKQEVAKDSLRGGQEHIAREILNRLK